MARKNKQDDYDYNNKYTATHYARLNIVTPKSLSPLIKQAAQEAGQSISVYVIEAVKSRMASEGFALDITEQTPDPSPDQSQK